MSKSKSSHPVIDGSFDDKLIEFVKNHPILYITTNDEKFIDRELKQNAWETVASNLKVKPQECKLRWKRLEDLYQKGQLNDSKTSEKLDFLKYYMGSDKEIPWYTQIHINKFLKYSHQPSCSKQPDNTKKTKNSTTQKNISIPIASAPKVLKIKNTNRQQDISRKSTLLFLESMAEVMTDFPPSVINKLRLKICKLVCEAEKKVFNEKIDNQDDNSDDSASNLSGFIESDVEMQDSISSP